MRTFRVSRNPGRGVAQLLLPHAACLAAMLGFASLPSSAFAQSAVLLDGTNDHVTFGAAPALGASQFTLETWFKRTGAGVATSTGSGGVTAVPLVAKGRAEADGSVVDMNYFFGIRGTDSVLVADYEEGTGQTSPGLNHPVVGTTPLQRDVWYHGAATFDGTTLRLYLNGNLEASLTVGASRLPQSASTQHASLGSALTSAGTAAGFFRGALDEARIWNVAKSQAQIQADMPLKLTSGTGLLGRWGLNEGSGTSAANSVVTGPAGTLANGAAWTTGYSFGGGEHALFFGGTDAYVGYGNPAALGLSVYTIECWFRRDGAGVGTNTGSGGAIAIPLVAHGRGDQDTAQVHVNWFLGIRESDGVLMGDFEESSAGASPSLNHPVFGTTAITAGGGWHHAAVTYDGTTQKLYLDGALEGSVVVGQPAGHPTVMPVSIGGALNTAGVASGFFHGSIDEARVWSTARTLAELQGAANTPIPGASAGLVARYGMNEGTGASVASSAGLTLTGTISGANWSWSTGAPFDLDFTSPAAPSALSASGSTSTSIALTWTDGSTNETSFEIERSTTGSGGPFTPRGTVGANVTTYDDTGLTPNTPYCYRVRAVNGTGASAYTPTACATTPLTSHYALDLTSSTYVGFGDPAALDLAQYTIECWFRRDGAGTGTNTGTGGVPDAIPLLTKGRGESEASNVDLNWFLGIRASDGVLIADFEEGAGGASPSLNHAVAGTTVIPANGVWHHAAAAYDGATWTLYLDGVLEATLLVGQPVASASTQQAAIGSALTSAGVAAGFFDGAIDEARVWSVARTLSQVRAAANSQIDTPTAGLVARWALDEGSGTAVGGTAGTTVNGAITGAGYAWVAPAPFNLAVNDPPAIPVVVSPLNGATGVPVSATLEVAVNDPDSDSLTVRFYGRPVGGGAPPADFTLVGLPDTQYYTGQLNGGTNAMLKSQMSWMIANRVSRDIRYAVQLGDCVEHGDNGGDPIEWMRADSSFSMIESPLATGLAEGLPYGICAGNHDQTPIGDANGSTAFYNQYFGVARFTGRSYYGGGYRGSNDNWFDLFSGGGMDFISIGLEYDSTPDGPVLAWADSLLKAYPNRRAMVSTHWLINTGNPGTFSTQGAVMYDSLKDNPNLFLMLGGHVPGEGRRSDLYQGRTVHSLLSDYQSRSLGGGGLLRIMEFSPANNVIRVRTYSSWTNTYETDADSSSQFTLPYDMSTAQAPHVLLGTVRVAAGGTATLPWASLDPSTEYEWYAVADDGSTTRTGASSTFTTAATTDVPSNGALAFALAPPTPNPAGGAVRVAFSAPAAARIKVAIYDVTGREVQVLADHEFAAGTHTLRWDGVSAGRPARSGIYFVRMSAPGFDRVRRIALVH
ncbi:MAG: fibronectin type III domain-containing protein [Candidatus Eisenbacteria bacterium]|nr:fibronectin type III domain-containing protein [Candidatus Eisenbacteria bacterium]